MALISASFRPAAGDSASALVATTSQARDVEMASQETDLSNQDVSLSEVRERNLSGKSKSKTQAKKTTKPKRRPQQGVSKRKEFFAKIKCTRSVISGLADPPHNPYMVWCHICKKNFSIRTKGTMEIQRHHRAEKHFKKDKRWRNEHLKSSDPVTLQPQHRVRGRNRKHLSKTDLAKELPKFIHSELVDIGERFPFFEDFIQGQTAPLITPESRARIQLCIIGDFMQN